MKQEINGESLESQDMSDAVAEDAPRNPQHEHAPIGSLDKESFWRTPHKNWLASLGGSPRVRFVSDLHLLSPRSRSAPLSALVDRQNTDALVLGGDIFDFRWSGLGSIAESVKAAVSELRDVVANTDLPVAYLLGNHDCLCSFVDELSKLEAEFSHFSLVPHHLLLGDTVFLHGDVLDATRRTQVTTPDQILDRLLSYRAAFEHTCTQPRFKHAAYDLAVSMRVHRAIPNLVRTPRGTIASLSKLLTILEPLKFADIRRVCFGHTHRPIQSAKCGNIEYRNGGACLRHLKHRTIDVCVEVSP